MVGVCRWYFPLGADMSTLLSSIFFLQFHQMGNKNTLLNSYFYPQIYWVFCCWLSHYSDRFCFSNFHKIKKHHYRSWDMSIMAKLMMLGIFLFDSLCNFQSYSFHMWNNKSKCHQEFLAIFITRAILLDPMTHTHRRVKSLLVSKMVCYIFHAKPLCKPRMDYV